MGSSAGRGNLALVPWVDFGDDTPDNQDLRINLVYNFKADMSGVYLILRVHFYQPDQNKYGKYLSLFLDNKSRYMREFLDENYKLRDDLLYEVDLASNQNMPKLHSDATIVAKYYEKGNIPSTDELVDDINYFLELRKFLLENYTDDTQISADEWVTALEDDSVIDDKMFCILEIMYNMDDYRATTSQLVEKRQELGFIGEKSYNKTIVDNSKYVKEFLNKKTIFNEDGTENLWMRFFYGESVKIEKDGKQTIEFQFKLKDELVEALGGINRKLDTKIIEKEEIKYYEKSYDSFYDYLIKNEFLFEKETIENYLLSLKVKPFAILTGNSGTGKTKLSQLFAKYIAELKKNPLKNPFSDSDDEYITIRAKTNMSSWKNMGWTLPKVDFIEYLPFEDIEGKYDIEVDGIKARCTLEFLTQLFYDNKDLITYFKDLYDQDSEGTVPLKIKKEDLKVVFSEDYIKESVINIKKRSNKSAFQANQWFLPKDFFEYTPFTFGYVPCEILVNDIQSNAKFRIMSRIRFEKNESLQSYLREKDGEEVNIKLKIGSINIENYKSKWSTDKKQSEPNEKDMDVFENYKIIPVGANWTENRHIVGYYNVITNEYQSTPAYDLIKQAQESAEPHFLILDEMNLSHVERYFADFLSAIESGENIPLYGENELKIPSNLFIIGTVNVDETTYMFSPKVLDRANVIEFETFSSMNYMLGKFNKNAPNGNIEYLENPLSGKEIQEYGIEDLRELFSGVSAQDKLLWDVLSEEITKFQSILKKSGFDFGFRVINEIIRFMAVSWEYEGKPSEFINWTRYFDACVKQKFLPKLHGSEKIIGETLDELYKICLDSVVETEDMAKYPQSYNKLKEMRKVLRKQRYVSFIN